LWSGVNIDGSFKGYDIFSEACEESYHENNGKRPLLIIDDAQKLAGDDISDH
jgi:hypothetical protein